MKVAIDLGHQGKRSRQTDRGAEHNGYIEADLTLEYAIVARKKLESLGHTTFLLAHENYSKRHAFCNDMNMDVHFQCHLNSPDGRYALIIHSSQAGDRCIALTEIMSHQFKRWLGSIISKVDVLAIKPDDNRYMCLNPGSPSLILEPLFLKNEAHLKFLLHENGITLVGLAIAEAIDEWSKTNG